jgi:hypothetical protein
MDFTKELTNMKKPEDICDSFLFGSQHPLFMQNIDQYVPSKQKDIL